MNPFRCCYPLLALVLTTTLGGCKAAARSSAAPTPSATAEGATTKQSYGAPLRAQTPQITLEALLREPSRFAEKTIRVSGRVQAVCQNQGCWLELGDATGAAHVKLKGHRFFVPTTSAGKQGEVEATVLPIVDQGHCEQEAQEQMGSVAKVELEATGVELF